MSDGTRTSDRALTLGDLRLVVVADAGEEVACDVQLLGRAHESVVRVGEHPLDLGREEEVLADLHAAVEHSPDGRPRRRNGSPAVQELVAEPGDPFAHPRLRPGLDRVLELLDLGVHRIHRGEEGLGHLVHDALDEDADGHTLLGRRMEPGWIERASALRGCLTHRDQERRRRDEAELLVDDLVLVRPRVGGHEHSEDVGPMALEERPRTAVIGPRREGLDDVGIHVSGKHGEQLLAGRVDEVDPARVHRRRH
jgi:hypothetical protein